MADYRALAEAMKDELIAFRRDFHKHPELAFEEVRTSGIVADELNKLGLEVQTAVGKTGVVGILEGAQDGPTVLYRADMDALPMQELNQTDYVSVHPGKMHACGHDAHTAIGLGVARLMTEQRDKLAGRIKFVFQPAEEVVGGAKAMIADGILENPRPDVSLGLHVWNSMELGKVAVTDGPSMAGSAVFDIIITGIGGHGAAPHDAADPVICAAQMITALQTIVSRNVDPLDTAVVSVTKMQASDAYNIIPEQVKLAGTVRTFKLEVRDLIERRMNEICRSLAAAMGCKAELDFRYNTLPVANHPEVAARVRTVFERLVDADKIITDERTMGSEDVGMMMDDIPGTFVFLGSANDERELNYPHHHPRFDIDEDCLPLGVALMSAALAEYLVPDQETG
jgi:amidohydrolase